VETPGDSAAPPTIRTYVGKRAKLAGDCADKRRTIMRFSFRLTFHRRLLLLTTIPMLGLAGVGGAFLLRLHREYADTASDVRTLQAFKSNLGLLEKFHTQLNRERNAALRFAHGTGAEFEVQFRKQIPATAEITTALLAEADALAAPAQALLNEERVKYIREPLAVLLPDTRVQLAPGTPSAAKIMGAYAKATFNSLVMAESYRSLLRTSQGLNYYDGLYTLNKMREIEAMIASLYQLGETGYAYRREDLGIIRKQYFALTESETYLRRYFPELRTHFDGVLKFDATSAVYWKYLADMAGSMVDGPLPPFSGAGGLTSLLEQRRAHFAQTLAAGFDEADTAMSALVAQRRKLTWQLSAVIVSVLGLSLGVNLLVTRRTERQLASTSTGISGSSEDVDAASAQLTSASEQISNNASAYAAALQEISAALAEMTDVARANEQYVSSAQTLSKRATTATETGLQTVDQLGAAMNSIQLSGTKITQIITRINEISFQTNILALNAAVEAAHAGAAGAGFSVVADEVRQLARRCAEAASETAALIEESTRSTDVAIARSTEVVDTFKEISAHVREVGQLVDGISKNFAQQAEGVSAVSTAVNQQDDVAQSTAAVAEETAAAALAMRTQVETLQQSVQQLDHLLGRSRAKFSASEESISPSNYAPSLRPEKQSVQVG
jgi:methyl-accepting chemotaxis protein